ncbi:hypothetical protein UFOVP270_30 [uncultured Caudovirales phage]|uniref:Uncharacterized protein n=1 Tax=uncultured Caudovirales phage TaxID=2100421 RepID=A0A6J5LJ82_9CAUD|nr:hypothetical protein UFOVP270_30 [uncultured Caudovirales phage]
MDPNYNYLQGMPNQNLSAMPYANKAIGEVKGYYDPYTKYGNNPQDFVNQIYGSFQDSPALQRERDLAGKGLRSAAAASGRINNPAYEREYADLMGSLGSDQMRRYFEDVMKERGFGLDAAKGAAGDVSNLYGEAGQLSYQHDREKELQERQNKSDMWRTGLKALGTAAGAYFGGAPGAAGGDKLAELLYNFFNKGSNSNYETGAGAFNPDLYKDISSQWW